MVHIDYQTIVDVVVKNDILPYYSAQYKIFLNHSEENYFVWTDYLMDTYHNYKHKGFSEFESKINALSDGVEGMIDQWNNRK